MSDASAGRLDLHTVIEAHGPAAAVVLTDDQVAVLGGGRTPPVRVSIAGRSIAARVGRMGGKNLVGFSKAARNELGIAAGDTVDVVIEHDAAPRTVEVPPDLGAALDEAGVRARFDALAFTHRKEHVRSVVEAKQAATRARRIAAVIAALRADSGRS